MIYLPEGIIYNGVIQGKDAQLCLQKKTQEETMFFIFRLLIHMVAILIISYLLPGVIWVEGVWAALVAAFLLGIVNAVLRPILIFFTLPITVLTFGLFLLVYQWPDAFAGVLYCKRVPCQRLLGRSAWLDFDQPCELGPVPGFARLNSNLSSRIDRT